MSNDTSDRDLMLRVLSAATFLLIFQASLVAPLIPALARQFDTSVESLGFMIPAYMIPYGVSALFYGPVSERVGRKAVILSLLGMTVLTVGGTATARTASEPILWRLACGIVSVGGFADRFGRKRIIPLGIMIGALSGLAFVPKTSLVDAAVVSGILSLGNDMSHPLLAGISTSLNPRRRGLAMGMNAFALFTGAGLGPLAFGCLFGIGFSGALVIFSLAEILLGIFAIPLLRGEDASAEKAH